jgi:hypothetical protein
MGEYVYRFVNIVCIEHLKVLDGKICLTDELKINLLDRSG